MEPVDREILLALLDREQTVHQLSKTIYKTADQYALRGHNSTLTYRLGKLAQEGLVRKREGRSGPYYVPLDNITYGRATVVVKGKGGTLNVEMGRVLYTDSNGHRNLIFLE
jgi:hypothetical protein